MIGGYLGAGKTTLVNSLLRQADGRRLAVLVNDFGALPIDSDLIEAQDDQIISLAGGCVCCSYGEDLVSSMTMLAAMADRPDHVLLEASGVAFPGAIAGTVGLLPAFALDGVVVLADAETVRGRADDKYLGSTIRQQLQQADIILLNKCDLAADAVAVEAWLGTVAPDVQVVPVTNAAVPIGVVLGAHDGREQETAIGGDAALPHHAGGYDTVRLEIGRVADAGTLAQALADPAPALSQADADALRLNIESCWNTGILSTEALNVVVTIGFEMTPDARPIGSSIRMVSASGGGAAAQQAAFEAGRQAIVQCGMDGYGLPQDLYDQWRLVEITFNPARMSTR
ncbi:MAG: GTP-binding protein [Rhodobacteraceae bacterium]|nr:GTP-binding protein [Paracoccaceae bacterium]